MERFMHQGLKPHMKKGSCIFQKKLINPHNTKSDNNLGTACTYDVEAPPMRKDSSKQVSKAQEKERSEEIHRHKCSRYAVQSDETTVCTRNWLDVFDVNPLNLHYFMAVFREANKKKMRIVGGWPYWSNTQQVKSRIIVNIQLRKVMNQQRISFTSSIVIHIE